MNEQLKKEIERLELAMRHGSANALPEDYAVRRVRHRKQVQIRQQIHHGFASGQINLGQISPGQISPRQINHREKNHA